MNFGFAEGEFFQFLCKACNQYNGGGISNPELDKYYENDPLNPCRNPCVWCNEGPVVMERTGEQSSGEITL